MTAGFLTIEAPQSLRTVLAIPCVIFFASIFVVKFFSCFSVKKIMPVPAAVIILMLFTSTAENFNIYFNRQAKDIRCWTGFSTEEFTAGKAARAALASRYSVAVSPYYLDDPAFKFGLYGYTGCEPFELSSSIPGNIGKRSNLLYLLPLAYTPLGDYLKEIYPDASTLDYFLPDGNHPLFRAYVIPDFDILNVNYRYDEHGANVVYYSERDFEGQSLKQKVPVIMLTLYEYPGFNVSSAKWSAILKAPASGNYIFELDSIGYSSLLIDGKVIAGNPGKEYSCDEEMTKAQIYLSKGSHPIDVKYNINVLEKHRCADMSLKWQRPGEEATSIISGSLLAPR